MFYLLVRIVKLNHLISIALVSIVGTVLTYCVNYTWVFLSDQKIEFRARLARYIFASVVSIGLNVICLHYAVLGTGLDPFYAQMLLLPLVVIFNFSTAKFWSLRPEPSRHVQGRR
jgi:putative flippase GtrA